MELVHIITPLAITGAGVVTGLLFAFSNFVLRSLAELPAETGMFAMNRINVRIINPIFLIFFLGTPLLCVLIVLQTVSALTTPGSMLLALGAVVYLLGPFAITITFNVPLNNKLAKTQADDAGQAWPDYQQRWQFWNHVRSYLGILSILLMTYGLVAYPTQ